MAKELIYSITSVRLSLQKKGSPNPIIDADGGATRCLTMRITPRKTLLLLLACVLLNTAPLNAQDPPNDGTFKFIGEIYKEKNSPPACCEAADLLLPKYFRLDRTYRQQTLICCGGGATSDITPGDIPAGIHVSVSGGHYWALPKAPVLIPEAFDDEDRVIQWRFRTPLYCGPGGNGEGCNIRVRVWAKERPKTK
jgi:hypothetical protein